MTLSSTRALANGVEIPVLGLGVYLSEPGRETQDAVAWALDLGYRHVDTAAVYHNEKDVGEAVRHSGVRREDVFVTTKLGNRDHGYDAALRAFEKSLKRLRLDYVDLYIIHWPVAQGRRESWRALERIYREGRAKAVGVSNYTVRHLEETLAHAEVAPMVDQVEFSPFLHQRDLLRYCEEHDIVVEAYSPLTRGRRLSHPTITDGRAGARQVPCPGPDPLDAAARPRDPAKVGQAGAHRRERRGLRLRALRRRDVRSRRAQRGPARGVGPDRRSLNGRTDA